MISPFDYIVDVGGSHLGDDLLGADVGMVDQVEKMGDHMS
jgi:hypothetical protein